MATVKDIFGTGISGKVGQVVFVQLKGKTLVRSLPKAKNKSNTPKQVINRKRFVEIIRFCIPFKFVVIPMIWNAYAQTMSGFNLFVKTNNQAFGPDGSISDHHKLQLSIGKLEWPEFFEAHRVAEGSRDIEVNWSENRNSGDLPWWDELMVISSGEGQYSDIKVTGLYRGMLGGIFTLPESPAVTSCIYLFFGSHNRKKYSVSACFDI